MKTQTLNPEKFTFEYGLKGRIVLTTDFEKAVAKYIEEEEIELLQSRKQNPNISWTYSDTYRCEQNAKAKAWREVKQVSDTVRQQLKELFELADKAPVDEEWHHLKYGVYVKNTKGAQWRSMPRIGYYADCVSTYWKEENNA